MCSIIFWIKNIIFRPNSFFHYLNGRKVENLSSNELSNLNFKKRKAIVEYAYLNSKFYKEFYDRYGFNPQSLKSENDWANVPILTKNDIRLNEKDFLPLCIDKSRLKESTTGGSTGEPLRVYHDKNNYLETFGWLVFRWWRVNPADNIAFVFRLTRSTFLSSLINKLIWFPTKRIYLDASSVSLKDFDIFIEKLKKVRPIIIQGYTGTLNEFCLYCIKKNIKFNFSKIVWCTSSPLTQTIRDTISSVFSGDVMDQYGSGEVYWIATECLEHNGLHIHSDQRHVEIIDQQGVVVGKDVVGRVLVTDLENKVFPIIRYENGDLSSISSEMCGCGLPYPILKKIYGRISSSIKFPDGGFISGDFFTTVFDNYSNYVERFQVYQNINYEVFVRVVLKDEANEIFLEEVLHSIEMKTKGKLKLALEIVESINNLRGGKTQFIFSEVE
jgi:phenylacetate-CoA ligase